MLRRIPCFVFARGCFSVMSPSVNEVKIKPTVEQLDRSRVQRTSTVPSANEITPVIEFVSDAFASSNKNDSRALGGVLTLDVSMGELGQMEYVKRSHNARQTRSVQVRGHIGQEMTNSNERTAHFHILSNKGNLVEEIKRKGKGIRKGTGKGQTQGRGQENRKGKGIGHDHSHDKPWRPSCLRTPIPCSAPRTTFCPSPCPTPCPTPCPSPHVTPCATPHISLARTLAPSRCPTPCPTLHPSPHPTPCHTPCPTSCPTPLPSAHTSPNPAPCPSPCQSPCSTTRPCCRTTPCSTSCETPCSSASPFPCQSACPTPCSRPSTTPCPTPCRAETIEEAAMHARRVAREARRAEIASEIARRAKQRATRRAERNYAGSTDIFLREHRLQRTELSLRRNRTISLISNILHPELFGTDTSANTASHFEASSRTAHSELTNKLVEEKQRAREAVLRAKAYEQQLQIARNLGQAHTAVITERRYSQAVADASKALETTKQLQAKLQRYCQSSFEQLGLNMSNSSTMSARSVVPRAYTSPVDAIEQNQLDDYTQRIGHVQDDVDTMNWMKSRMFDRMEAELTREVDLSRTEGEARLEGVRKEEELLQEREHAERLHATAKEDRHARKLEAAMIGIKKDEQYVRKINTKEGLQSKLKKHVGKIFEEVAEKELQDALRKSVG
eukprot:TRINITY_DN16415_c0_g1_i1.p1 TRINITY_DN16415_c0_g1~~TRINITY_DN16415_c0_g1_i1.p1  ORF type:complete len:672 (-),score=76.30 TRINITY_DN16415_c0_g1_i1:110-2125(-)